MTAMEMRARVCMPADRQGETDRCGGIAVMLLDSEVEARERRAECLRRWGHPVRTYAMPTEIRPPLPRKIVLIVRQELPEEPGMAYVQRMQRRRVDVRAIVVTRAWSPALAAAASSRTSVWLRPEPISDEELHVLVDLCSL